MAMKKALLSIALVLSILMVFPHNVKASETKTVLYLDYGDIKISEDSITGYDQKGSLVTKVNSAGYTITQFNPNTALNKSITIASGSQDIEIENINIARTDENGYALCVLKNTTAIITIKGENHLVAGTYRAGIDIAVSATVTIKGNGTLYAQSELEAGIGGGSGRSNGTLVIDSGTIYATGGLDGYSAGIGGGSSGKGGNITINGGTVVAVGGAYAAGIGGGNLSSGGTITINGGTVTAVGGANGAGIGGGFAANGGNITINGGSVKATAGTGAENIGKGYKCSTAFTGIYNSKGNVVSLLKIPITDFETVYQNGINNPPITTSHVDDECLYFYTDSSNNIATVYMNDGSVNFIEYNVNGYKEIFPYTNEDERFLDYLIASDIESSSVISGFSLEKIGDSFELKKDNMCVDTFKFAQRGDVNLDGIIDGTDAVVATCIENGMLSDTLKFKLADINADQTVNSEDIEKMNREGLLLGSFFYILVVVDKIIF